MKLLKKTVALLLVCLSAAFAGCAYFENVTSESTLGNISVGSKTDEVTYSYESPFDNPIDYPKELYPVGNKMFAKLEITKVYDEAYFLVSDGEFKTPFLLAEVTVFEDFYKYTEAQTSFTVMIPLESGEDAFFQKAKDVFERSEFIYAYCSIRGGENYFNVEMAAKNADKNIKLGVFSDDINIDLLRLIPCVGGRAELAYLLDEENEYIERLKNFVYDGQAAAELEKNIKHLYEKLSHDHQPCRWLAQAPLGHSTRRAFRLVEQSATCGSRSTATDVATIFKPPFAQGSLRCGGNCAKLKLFVTTGTAGGFCE